MTKILVVEDDPTTARSIELMLTNAGFSVFTTDLGDEAIDLAKIYGYDFITLNDDLPDIDGIDVLRMMRLSGVNTPVLMLAGRDDLESRLQAFGFGADDYMTKPFHREELIARIHTIIRRTKETGPSVVYAGPICANLDSRVVTVDGSTVNLTGREYQIMELLSLRKGTTLTKEMFIHHLYGGMDEPELKIIDVFVAKLRRKLSAVKPDAGQHIETVWGLGYRLTDLEDENV